MASHNSNEWANRVAVPSVFNPAYTDGGRMRVQTFSFTTPVGIAEDDTINLCKLPAGAKVIGGYVQHGAMGVSSTLDIGTAADPNKYASAIDVAAAGVSSAVASTAALNYGAVTTTEENIIATAAGAAWADGEDLNGHIVYVKD